MKRSRLMVVVIPLVWASAMAGARYTNPWAVIGLAAITLTGAVIAARPSTVAQLLARSARDVGFAAVSASLMVVVTHAVFPQLTRIWPAIGSETAALYAKFLFGPSVALCLAFVIPVVLCEELIWRGGIQGWLETEGWPRWSVVVLSAAIYAAAHIPLGSPLLVAVAFVCGIYWSTLRDASGNLTAPLAAHLAWDIALILFPLVRLH